MTASTAMVAEGLQVEHILLKQAADTSVEICYYVQQRIDIVCRFAAGEAHHEFRFTYTPEYLSRFSHSGEKPFGLLHSMRTMYDDQSAVCCELKEVFYQLGTSARQGVYQRIFLESQALLVLLHTHSACQAKEDTPCFHCKFLNIPSEKQKIMQARVILMINLAEPPTIPQLARAVHINECYLKKGFKEMYGVSVFDFVQQERVQKAKQLLQGAAHSIQHIALELGYSNPSNFTNAFKKLTGKAPSEWLKEHPQRID